VAALTRRISAGFATGLDSVFVAPSAALAHVEPELRRRAVRGRDVLTHRIDDPGLEIIIPYRFAGDGTPSLVELAEYPCARAYLETARDELSRRHCVRVWDKAWFDLHDPVPMDLAAQPKILVPDLASSNRFAFDPGERCPLHSAYYLLPTDEVDPLYLTAVLNSRPIEFLVRLLAPIAKDGFSRYRKQFLAPLPVPHASRKDQRAVRRAVEAGDHARAESLVIRSFALSADDLARMAEFIRGLGASATQPT
jgi:hypothetical protein